MKKLLLSMIALVSSVACHAQLSDGVTATLQAGETTTVFYGYDAFKDAVAVAPDDAVSIITLSPGTFSSPGNVSKSVEVYGAGFFADTEKGISATTIAGDFNIKSTETFSPVVRLEGIYVNGNLNLSGSQTIAGCEFVKCSWNRFNNSVETDNTIIRQSYIRENINGNDKLAKGLVVSNSYFNVINGFAAGSSVSVSHCILVAGDWNNHGPYYYVGNIINPATYYASILAGATCYYNVSSDTKMSNGGNNTVLGNYDKSVWIDYKTLFADGQDNLNFLDADGKPRTWVLAEPTKYVDADGATCGVTGGDFPWNPIPATPRIIKTSVDAKSEAGKLKVTVKAEARPIE